MLFYCIEKKNKVFLEKRKIKKSEKGECMNMLNKQILKLREELNNSIINGADYEVIYKLSTELDELIVKYYKQKAENRT